MKYYILITILILVTYFIRSSFILFGHRLTFSKDAKLALSFLVISILPAMIFPGILVKYEPVHIFNERLVASIFAIGISLKSKNIMTTMIGGLSMLLFLHQF